MAVIAVQNPAFIANCGWPLYPNITVNKLNVIIALDNGNTDIISKNFNKMVAVVVYLMKQLPQETLISIVQFQDSTTDGFNRRVPLNFAGKSAPIKDIISDLKHMSAIKVVWSESSEKEKEFTKNFQLSDRGHGSRWTFHQLFNVLTMQHSLNTIMPPNKFILEDNYRRLLIVISDGDFSENDGGLSDIKNFSKKHAYQTLGIGSGNLGEMVDSLIEVDWDGEEVVNKLVNPNFYVEGNYGYQICQKVKETKP